MNNLAMTAVHFFTIMDKVNDGMFFIIIDNVNVRTHKQPHDNGSFSKPLLIIITPLNLYLIGYCCFHSSTRI